MFNPIKKYLEMIDRDVENNVREDLKKKGFSQKEIDWAIKNGKQEKEEKDLTPKERLKKRIEKVRREGNPRIISHLK